MYHWSLNEDGTPGVSFILNKIHSRHGHKWIHQVHEVLNNEIEEVEVYIPITLTHYQDRTKSRRMYLEILERAVQENPNDARDMYCLGREYKAYFRYDDAIKCFHDYLKLESATWDQERSTAMRYIGDCYKAKEYYEEAIMWYQCAIGETPNVREPKYDLGSLYHDIGDYENARIYLNEALKINKKNDDYINEEAAWNGSIYDLLSISEYYTGHYEEA
jgi:tetratricopeptide (TPR) repeat protein